MPSPLPLVIVRHRCAWGLGRALQGEVDLFSLHLERTVGKDGTFPFLGQRWPLDRMLHRHRVQLRWIPEERLWVLQGGIVKLTGKPPKSFHWDSSLAVDDLLISHLRRRFDAQRLSAPHSVPLFFRDHR